MSHPSESQADVPWVGAALAERERQQLRREARVVTALPGGRCREGNAELWNLASNDYLDLAGDPRLHEAATAAMRTHGLGARASALVTGRTPLHEDLELAFAEFEGTESALLFPTGFATNVGTVTALVGTGDTVFCDRLNHASLVDGCRLSGAKLQVYRHDRLERLSERLLRWSELPDCGRALIVTDSIFSMDGDAAPLEQLCGIAERFGVPILIDEAHATGVFGERGCGIAERDGVEHRIAIRVGTCSKALGCLGGFVSGSGSLIEWLRNSARTQVYSTALPPPMCAAIRTALRIVNTEPERRRELLATANWFRQELRSAGATIPEGVCGPIIPVIVGCNERVLRLGNKLRDAGFLVGVIRPPTVSRGTARLRITITAAHPRDVLTRFVETFARQVQSLADFETDSSI